MASNDENDDKIKKFRDDLAQANQGAGFQEGPSFADRLEQSKQIINQPNDPNKSAALQALSKLAQGGMNLLPQDSMTLPGGQKFDPTGAIGEVRPVGWQNIPSAQSGDIIKNVMGDVRDTAKSQQLADALKKLGFTASEDRGFGRTIVQGAPEVPLGSGKIIRKPY